MSRKSTQNQIEVKNLGKIRMSKPTATRDLIAFDIGLLFTHGTKEVQLYVDPELQPVINTLLEKHGQIVLKVNWFSDDLTVFYPEAPVSS